jgi:four helix bundle protein
MRPWERTMRERTKQFALDVIKFVRGLPNDVVLESPRKQLVRAACGVAGNYRSACRARSDAEFAAKLGVVLDEADEAEGWLDVFHADGTVVSKELSRLRQESQELRAIFFKANQTARAKHSEKRL